MIQENNELILILATSIKTASEKAKKKLHNSKFHI